MKKKIKLQKSNHLFSAILLFAFFLFFLLPLFSAESQKEFDAKIGKKYKGIEIYFNAWGGSESINRYLQTIAKELKKKYGLILKHVKIKDTTNVVRRILAEQKAGKTEKGSVDLVWINGENFKFLKEHNLLSKIGLKKLPSEQFLDYEYKTLKEDFTIPTDDLEAPWGTAQLVLVGNPVKTKSFPKNLNDLVEWIKKYPGQFTYPKPPNFHGTSFVKQILLELNKESIVAFSEPITDRAFKKYTKKVWDYLDILHPHLWRKGQRFPKHLAQMHILMNQGILSLSLSFNPYEADNLIRMSKLPAGVKTYNFDKGTVGNTHFLAIPFNSSNKNAGRTVINYLLSPRAQAKKSNPEIWGDPTVLAVSKLPDKKKELFKSIQYRDAAPKFLYPVLPEPHPSWTTALEEEWIRRYGIL